MKKGILSFLIVCVLCAVIAGPGANASAAPQSVTIYIDGQPFYSNTPALLINATTYVPIRAFSQALGNANVSWDDTSKTVTVETGVLSLTLNINNKYLEANNRYIYLPDGCMIIDDSIMIPVRALLKAFDASAEWDGDTRTLYIYSGSGALENGDSFYNTDSVYWLSRIIYAESGFEPLEGQIGVGNVIMNRMASGSFPDTVYGVVFDNRYGSWQFTPAANGTIYNTPSEQAIVAAKLSLEGYNLVGNSLFFVNPEVCVTAWFEQTRTLVTIIGHHAFYA